MVMVGLTLLTFVTFCFGEPPVHVHSTNPRYSTESFAQDGDFKVHSPSEKGRQLPVKVRNAIYEDSGLSNFIQNWDEVDRDVFLIHARSVSISKLTSEYPQIPVDILARAQSAILKSMPAQNSGK